MIEIALLCRLLVAGVLVVSAVSKLLDRTGTQEAVAAFGVPSRWTPTTAALLAPVELVVACLLVTVAAPAVGPLAALLLLGVFTAAVLENLRRGRRPQCHCFGRIGSSDISGRTVLRNVCLSVAALAALLAPGVTAASYLKSDGAARLAQLALASAVAVAGLVGAEARAGRRRSAEDAQAQVERLESELDATADRGPAPDFVLPTLDGEPLSLPDLIDDDRPLLLTFLSPGCGPCRRLRPFVARWHEVFADRVRVAAIVSGSRAANQSSFGTSAFPVLLDEDRETAERYQVLHRPSAVVVTSGGRLLGPAASGEISVRRLLDALLSGHLSSQPAEVPAEALTLSSSPGPRATVTTLRDHADLRLVDEATGASVTLDGVGAIVWQCLDGRSSLADIVQDIAEEFQAPKDRVEADVLTLVTALGRTGLLAGVAPDAVEESPAAVAPHSHSHGAPDLVASS